MTTDTMRTHDAEHAVEGLVAEGLRPSELAELERCVNAVRAGELEFYVKLTNKKQTASKKRMPGEHYDPDPTLVPGAHKGWLVAAPLNKEGNVYLHVYDEARAKERGEGFGHTRVTLKGLRSFEVVTDPRDGEQIVRPGPLAEPESESEPTPQAQAVVAFDAALASQALMLQSQALMCQAQALMLRAYEQPKP